MILQKLFSCRLRWGHRYEVVQRFLNRQCPEYFSLIPSFEQFRVNKSTNIFDDDSSFEPRSTDVRWDYPVDVPQTVLNENFHLLGRTYQNKQICKVSFVICIQTNILHICCCCWYICWCCSRCDSNFNTKLLVLQLLRIKLQHRILFCCCLCWCINCCDSSFNIKFCCCSCWCCSRYISNFSIKLSRYSCWCCFCGVTTVVNQTSTAIYVLNLVDVANVVNKTTTSNTVVAAFADVAIFVKQT